MKEDNKLAKWLEGAMDEQELKAFESLPEFETYRKIKDFSAQLKAPETDIDTLYQNITAKKTSTAPAAKVVRLQSPWLVRIAAVLVVALCLTFFFYTNHTTTEIAENGKRTEFLLPDNSEVVLNAGSQAEFKSWNWNKKRSVNLKGEAFFKVAKGKTFDVNTSLGKVTVIGTQFNVKARENRFEVTCFEGKVKVSYNNNEVFLTPGESISLEEGKEVEIPETTNQQPGWTNNTIAFHEEKPENVIKELERQYNVKIELKGKLINTFNASNVPTNDLDTALEVFAGPYGLKVEKAAKDRIILTME